ncbi:MAG: FAD-dependent oxidoreductase, partial [Gaiellaceae bacterium]
MSERFDLIVIGGGSAARDAAGKARREHGARVALVEKERWGGSCPNVACQPTKAYLVAAELTHDVNELAPTIGIETGAARVDLERVHAWKESLKKPQDDWKSELMDQGYTIYMGTATFVDPHTVRV